jgi:hypothetical protein
MAETTDATAQNARNIEQTAKILDHSGAPAEAINIGLVTAHPNEANAALALHRRGAPGRPHTHPARRSANAAQAMAMASMAYLGCPGADFNGGDNYESP